MERNPDNRFQSLNSPYSKKQIRDKRMRKQVFSIVSMSMLLIAAVFICAHTHETQQKSSAAHNAAASPKKTNYYQSWGVFTQNCHERYFVESDHTAFNEGFRYSVFDGMAVFSEKRNDKNGNKRTIIHGSGADINISGLLADTYRSLDIGDEEKCKVNLCTWAVSISKNGSKMAIIWDTEQNKTYVVEALL